MHRFRRILLTPLFILVQLTSACSENSPSPDLFSATAIESETGLEIGQELTGEIGTIQQLVDESTLSANAMYNGLRTAANLNLPVANEFFHNAHAGVFPQIEKLTEQTLNEADWVGLSWFRINYLPFFNAPSDSLFKTIVNTTSNCGPDNSTGNMTIQSYRTDAAGTRLTQSEISAEDEPARDQWVHQLFTVDYSNCIAGTPTGEYNGRAHVFISRNSVGGSPYKTRQLVYVFEDLAITINNETFQIDGSSQWPDYISCTDSGVLTNNLHIQHLGTGQSTLLDSLKHYWPNPYSDECRKNSADTYSYVSGTMYLSDHGSVEFYIPEHIDPLNDKWTNDLNNVYFFAGDSNVEALTGTMSQPLNFNTDEDLVTHLTKLTVTNDIKQSSESITHTSWDFIRGSMLDLDDDDADGMNNSWEIIHGLDPNDASDASNDPDEDGLSNLVEFNSWGYPNLKSVRGVELDDKLLGPWPNDYVNALKLQMVRSLSARNLIDEYYIVTVDVDKEGEWILSSQLDGVCTIIAESNQLRCDEKKIRELSVNNRILAFSFKPEATAQGFVGFNAAMHAYDHDHNPDNNTVSWESWYPGR